MISAFIHAHLFASLLVIGGGGAFIIALINSLFKEVFATMINFLISTIFEHKAISDSYAIIVLNMYLAKHAKSFGLSEQLYDADRRHIKSEGRDRVIFTRRNNRSYRLFFYRGAPILLTPQKYKDGETVSNGAFRFIVGTVNWEKLLIDAAKYYDQEYDKREPGKNFRVIRHVGSNRINESRPPSTASNDFMEPDDLMESNATPINYVPDEITIPKPFCSMSNIALSPDMTKIVKDAKFWMQNREWYGDRDITWRRGFLLHGSPGCGKTSLVRAIAEDLDLVVHIFDLSSMDNEEFVQAWAETKGDGARICLFEDFDSTFHGRENICDSSDLTFDTILNAIDGLELEDGLLLFITTNHYDKIDPALGVMDDNGMSSRPGRVDRVAKIGLPSYEGRYKIAFRILKDEALAHEIATIGDKDSGAQVQERSINKALSMLWGDLESDGAP